MYQQPILQAGLKGHKSFSMQKLDAEASAANAMHYVGGSQKIFCFFGAFNNSFLSEFILLRYMVMLQLLFCHNHTVDKV